MDKTYEVGYGKPPVHTQFRKGVCANPKGRGARKRPPFEDIVDHVLETTVQFRSSGRLHRATRAELVVKRLVTSALQGNSDDAKRLLELRRHGNRHPRGALTIHITGGLPDHLQRAPEDKKVR